MRSQARPVLNLPEDVQTAEGWRSVLAGLARDEAEMEVGLEEVRAERKALALDIARGVPAAVKRNAELNARQVELLNNLDLLLVVRGAAQEKLAEAELAEAAEAEAARRGRFRRGAEAAGRLAAEVDGAAGALKAKLDAFRAAVDAMAPHGLDAARGGKLLSATKLRAALHAAGLGGHLGLERVSARHQETLESWAKRLLAGELDEAPPAPADARVVPGQLGPLPALPPVPPAAAPDPSVRW